MPGNDYLDMVVLIIVVILVMIIMMVTPTKNPPTLFTFSVSKVK